MSKQTILICDRHLEAIPASGTYVLSHETKGIAGRLDLCQACIEEAIAFFTQKKFMGMPDDDIGESPAERRKRLDRERHQRLNTERKADRLDGIPSHAVKEYWPFMEAKVMKVVHALGENIHIDDVAKGAEVTRSTAANTLRRLVEQGRVGTTGGRGRWRRYHVPKN